MASTKGDKKLESVEESIRAWLRSSQEDGARLAVINYMTPLLPGISLVSASNSGAHPSVLFAFTVQPEHCNGFGNLHGGCASTLFDFCTSMPLVHVSRPGFWQYLGVSRTLNVTYMRPVPAREEVLIDCELVQVGKKLATVRATMRRRSDDVLLAICEHGKVNVDADVNSRL